MQPCEQRDNVMDIKASIGKIKQTLYEGNGKPSILSQLEVGNEKFSEIDKKLAGLDKKFDSLASYGRIVSLGVLASMGAIFWQMVQKHNADTYYNTDGKQAEVSNVSTEY